MESDPELAKASPAPAPKKKIKLGRGARGVGLAEEIKGLRDEVKSIEKRVAALEAEARSKSKWSAGSFSFGHQ